MPIKPSNIKLLFTMRNIWIKDIEYIFLISEDKYQYRLALYHYKFSSYSLYTLNKITQDMEFKKEDSLVTKELNDMIKNSKNVEEYKFVNKLDYSNIVVKLVRKIKIENILQ